MPNNVAVAVDQVLQNAAGANATGATMNVGGLPGVGLQVTGTFTATVTPKASIDGNFLGVQALNLITGAWVTSITAPGIFWVPLPGADQFQAPVSGWSAGAVTVTAKGIDNPPGVAASSSPKQAVQLTDGTNSQPMASAATLSAANSGEGAAVGVGPGEWSATSNPGVNAQASASKAAGGAGVRHVCRSISFSVASDGTAPTAVQLVVNLRDGATGAGTVLQSWTVAIPASAGAFNAFHVGGLNLVGSANTAMTLEFASAGGAHVYEACNIAGFDVN